MDLSNIKKGQRIAVAMSGGVDSSVTAAIIKDVGAIPIGITLKMFKTDIPVWEDAKRVAEYLDIEWHSEDYSEYFTQDVIAHFIRAYKFGETPNPCALCNRVAKTKYLFDQMQRYDCEKIATGHYARTITENGQTYIAKSLNIEKDQSYYLSLMEPFHANLLLFPLGDMDKSRVREIALEKGIPVAEKPDSQEACFLQGQDYREFLEPFSKKWRKGNFILHNKIVGKNKGIHHYTPGQRRGLEISHTEPLYVKSVNGETGDVYLGEKKEVFARGVKLRDCSFFPNTPLMGRVTAKLRYRMKDEPCILERAPEGKASLLFDKSQFAPAPGQTAAIYIDDKVIGGGTITGIF